MGVVGEIVVAAAIAFDAGGEFAGNQRFVSLAQFGEYRGGQLPQPAVGSDAGERGELFGVAAEALGDAGAVELFGFRQPQFAPGGLSQGVG